MIPTLLLAVAAVSTMTGDFDRDSHADRAFVRQTGAMQEVVVRHRAGETIVFRTRDAVPLLLSRLAAGTHPAACAKGAGPRGRRCIPRSVTSRGDTLQFGAAETAQAAAIWNGRAFAVVWLSD